MAALGAAPAAPALSRQRRTRHAHSNSRQKGRADVSRNACRRHGGGGHHAHPQAKRCCTHETGPLPHELRVFYAPGTAVSTAWPPGRSAAGASNHTHVLTHTSPPRLAGPAQLETGVLERPQTRAGAAACAGLRARVGLNGTHGAGSEPEKHAPASSPSPSVGPPFAPPPWRPAALVSETPPSRLHSSTFNLAHGEGSP